MMKDNTHKSIKLNIVFNMLKVGSSIIFPLITFPYISRVLQPEYVGRINFVDSFIGYFTLIAGLGISTYGIRECAAARSNNQKLSKTASQIFSINVITTIFAYALLLIILVIANKKLQNYRNLIIIQSTSIVFITMGADWLNSAMEDFQYITLRTIAFQLVSVVLMFVFVKTPNDYYKYAIISVSASICANLANIFYRKKFCKVSFTIHLDLRRHIEPILWLFAMAVVQTIFSNADITMLGIMKGDYQVGLYSTAHKVTKIIGQVIAATGAVVIPQLTVAFDNKNYDRANQLLSKVLLLNFTIGLPCVVGVLAMSKDIIYIVGGNGYLEAAPVLSILIISTLFSLVGGNFLGNVILIPMKREKYYMFVCMITAIVNVILNAVLIPKFNALGAAIATAMNGFLICVLLLIKVDTNIKIEKPISLLKAPFIGCIGIVLCCFLCSFITNYNWSIFFKIFSSVIMYTIVQIALKNLLFVELSKSTINKLKRS